MRYYKAQMYQFFDNSNYNIVFEGGLIRMVDDVYYGTCFCTIPDIGRNNLCCLIGRKTGNKEYRFVLYQLEGTKNKIIPIVLDLDSNFNGKWYVEKTIASSMFIPKKFVNGGKVMLKISQIPYVTVKSSKIYGIKTSKEIKSGLISSILKTNILDYII